MNRSECLVCISNTPVALRYYSDWEGCGSLEVKIPLCFRHGTEVDMYGIAVAIQRYVEAHPNGKVRHQNGGHSTSGVTRRSDPSLRDEPPAD
ncbi:hypothetical protein KSX_33120 [Ktedonospora formicarum]|uniref:Uncharacterized protein n=1 Tax=Ktedonospora formicarum TaxID=2778364 RepID=A0A8J3HWP2_9CHLR|nr:hypothetical protein KSX_33120 [Ktedonospora formicarum]